MKLSRNNLGFSIIEMLLSTLMVVFLSAVSYKVLKTQTVKQMETIRNQKSGSVSQVALNAFQEDMERNDENWTRFGFPSIFPHQGFGYENNFYLDSNVRDTESLNDGITFLRRDSKSDRLYNVTSLSKRFCYPSAQIADEDQNLYGTQIQLDSTEGLNEGDWVIAYQAGTSALAVISAGGISIGNVSSQSNPSGATTPGVSGLSSGGFGTAGAVTGESIGDEEAGVGVVGMTSATAVAGAITLRMPNAAEMQTTAANTSGTSTGFVTKAGVVPASFDMLGTATADTSDDLFCFEKKKMRLQKIASPVSYFMDYRTSDGEKKSATNTYQLDSQGNKIRMLVRAEYVNGAQVRKYITEANEVGFTYDLLNDNETISFSGEDSVQVIRDVGRSKTGTQLLDLSVVNPSQAANQFQSTYRIMAVKMKIGYQSSDEKQKAETDLKKSRENQTQFREIKVALDPSLREELYQDETRVLSSVTENLNTLPKSISGSAVNEQIGKPLYLINNNGNDEVLVPVSTFEVSADGSMGAASAGAVYVYLDNGCAVNANRGSCEPTQTKSAITFDPGFSGKFFPNTVSQVTLENGNRRIVVGGVSMVASSDGATKRFPGIGIIELSPNES